MILDQKQIYINDNHINDIVLVEIGGGYHLNTINDRLYQHQYERRKHTPDRPSELEERIARTAKEETPTAKAINDLIDAGYVAYGSLRWDNNRMYQPMVLFNK